MPLCGAHCALCRSGWADSDIATSALYTLKPRVLAPTFSPDGGTHASNVHLIEFTMGSATDSATIRYTINGPDPAWNSGHVGTTHTLYSSLDYFGEYTIRAIAYRSGWVDSPVSSTTFYLKRIVAPPYFTPNQAEAVENTRQIRVSITSSTNQATDGADPYLSSCQTRFIVNGGTPSSSNGTLGNRLLFAASTVEATYTVQAISFKAGWADSVPITSGVYTTRAVVATPTFTPDGGSHSADTRSISFSTSSGTAGTDFRRTVHEYDGVPTSTDTVWNDDANFGAADLTGSNYLEFAFGNTTRIKACCCSHPSSHCAGRQ